MPKPINWIGIETWSFSGTFCSLVLVLSTSTFKKSNLFIAKTVLAIRCMGIARESKLVSHSPCSGHQLANTSAEVLPLRCSIPHERQAVVVL